MLRSLLGEFIPPVCECLGLPHTPLLFFSSIANSTALDALRKLDRVVFGFEYEYEIDELYKITSHIPIPFPEASFSSGKQHEGVRAKKKTSLF